MREALQGLGLVRGCVGIIDGIVEDSIGIRTGSYTV